MSTMTIPRGALPSFFSNLEIVETDFLQSCQYLVHNSLRNDPVNCEISADSVPMLLCTKEVREIYQSNDYARIRKLQEQAQKDLQPIYDNLDANKENAWVKVRSEGEEFFMSWSETGCIWVRAIEADPANGAADANDPAKRLLWIEVGTYSSSGNVLGLHKYNVTAPSVITSLVVAGIIAAALAEVVTVGLGFVFSTFAVAAAKAAAALGMEAFTMTISTAALSTIGVCLVFFTVFIGLMVLWDWANRKYTIRLQIFNWDTDNEWSIMDEYKDNAELAEKPDKKITDVKLPKMLKPGSIIPFPGFKPIEVLDSVCYYASIVWENKQTFMEGCSMALKIQKGMTGQGFMWAFSCPRFGDNKQAADDGLVDPKTYWDTVKWNKNPKDFVIHATDTKVPIFCSTEVLSGAKGNLYEVKIDISK